MKLLSNSGMTHCVKSVQQTQIRHQFMYWKTCPGWLQCCTRMAGPCVHMVLLISSEWQRRRVLLGPLDQDLLFLYSCFFPAPIISECMWQMIVDLSSLLLPYSPMYQWEEKNSWIFYIILWLNVVDTQQQIFHVVPTTFVCILVLFLLALHAMGIITELRNVSGWAKSWVCAESWPFTV